MEYLVLGLFCAGLLTALLTGVSVIYALCGGMLLFFLYGLHKKIPAGRMLGKIREGILASKTILIVMLLMGALTSLWRACGAIPEIVTLSFRIMRPEAFPVFAFLLNCLVSLLTGTSFGTVGTTGVICMTIASAMGLNPIWSAGAILSGIYFGDRCSPVSTSAILTSEITGSDLRRNLYNMVRSAAIPWAASVLIYLTAGYSMGGTGEVPDVRQLMQQGFQLHWICLLPIGVVFILVLLRVNISLASAAGILLSVVVGVGVQHISLGELLRIAVTGYHAGIPEIAVMLDGGGALSMMETLLIITISSGSSGILRETGLMEPLTSLVGRLQKKWGDYPAMLLTSFAASAIGCSQTFALLMTNQIFEDLVSDRQQRALDLEDSAALTASLIPWCIACATPLAILGATAACIPAACYVYLIMLWRLLTCRKLKFQG